VHKFGGACVADAGVIAQGVSMVADCASRGISPFLVVSAMGGSPKVTDLLMQAVEDAEKRDESYLLHLSTVREVMNHVPSSYSPTQTEAMRMKSLAGSCIACNMTLRTSNRSCKLWHLLACRHLHFVIMLLAMAKSGVHSFSLPYFEVVG
jgi:aspartokinase